jgi:hypothetical protein
MVSMSRFTAAAAAAITLLLLPGEDVCREVSEVAFQVIMLPLLLLNNPTAAAAATR